MEVEGTWKFVVQEVAFVERITVSHPPRSAYGLSMVWTYFYV